MEQWENFRLAITDAYTKGQRQEKLDIVTFQRWHAAVLPHGGVFRESNAVSLNAGPFFKPLAPPKIIVWVNGTFLPALHRRLSAPPAQWSKLALLHFLQWQAHPWPDGNKRHCLIVTAYGCGWSGFPLIDIGPQRRYEYITALVTRDLDRLARLFERSQLKHIQEEK